MGCVRSFAETLANLKAIHLRHHHVQEHDIRQPCGDSLHGLHAAGCRDDFITFLGQYGANDLDVFNLIIHDQHYPQ